MVRTSAKKPTSASTVPVQGGAQRQVVIIRETSSCSVISTFTFSFMLLFSSCSSSSSSSPHCSSCSVFPSDFCGVISLSSFPLSLTRFLPFCFGCSLLAISIFSLCFFSVWFTQQVIIIFFGDFLLSFDHTSA